MRTALISDIHGNHGGLLAALADIEQQKCDRVFCLGDLVDGGPQSVEVVNLVRESNISVVQGNHDEYPSVDLPLEITDYLSNLPEAIVEGGVIYTHTSPRVKKAKITESVEAWNVFEETTYRRIFVGDMHVPLIFGQACADKVSATNYEISYGRAFAFAEDDRYIICVGSLGYSRDAYNRLRYAIFDDRLDLLLFRAPDGPILIF